MRLLCSSKLSLWQPGAYHYTWLHFSAPKENLLFFEELSHNGWKTFLKRLISRIEETIRHLFYFDKSWNGKTYPFANVKFFWHLIWRTFWHLDRASSTKTDLQTCNLWTVWSVKNSSHAVLEKTQVYKNASKLKFIYSEKATKFCEISTVDLTVTT